MSPLNWIPYKVLSSLHFLYVVYCLTSRLFLRRSTVDQNRLCNELGHSNGSCRSTHELVGCGTFLPLTQHLLQPYLGFFKPGKFMTSSGLCCCSFLGLICSPHISSWLIQTSYSNSTFWWSLPTSLPSLYSILLPCSTFLHSTYYPLNLSCSFICTLEYNLHESWNFVSPIHCFHPQDLAYRKHAMYKWQMNAFTYPCIERI